MSRKNKKKSSSPAAGKDVYTGRLEVTRSGMGFVIVPDLEQDVLVKRENLHHALNGDEVKVEVRSGRDSHRRPEGTIVEIVRRKQTEFSGRVEVHPHFAFFVPDGDKIPVDLFIPLHLLNGAHHGDKAMARIVEWNAKTKNPVGEIVSVLTDESANEIAMQGLLVENGFPLSFPDDVLEEAARYSDILDKQEIKKRKDMRDVLTLTIDPVDARDFDDALSFRELKNGNIEVGVHIADVSHYMQADSALDKEAYKRATSVYLPDRVAPMLPERLSNELCSLRPNEDKFTFSAVFELTKQGKIKDYWLGKTVIHSDKRYSYEQVQEVIEGADNEYRDELLLLNEIAQTFRAQRFKKGAINFSSQEVRFKLDATGKPIGIVVKESKEAHQLIEEFMLLANKTVAEHVGKLEFKNAPIPFPYRVHDVPDEEKLRVFSLFAGRFGVKFDLGSPDSIAKSFNKMLETVQGKPEQHVLEQLGIRTMSKAVYTTDNIGHYGLGFDHYCHFTSPIRRYPDVLVHRILEQALNGQVKVMKHLEVACRHCSDQERRAMETERSANKYKQVEYMQSFVGEDFEAVISGVATFGFWAETVEHKCEGMVSITELTEFDDFEYHEGEYALIGRNTGVRFAMGDKVKVRVVTTNLEKRQIDYSVLEMPMPARRKKRADGASKRIEGAPKRSQASSRQKSDKGKKTNSKRKKK